MEMVRAGEGERRDVRVEMRVEERVLEAWGRDVGVGGRGGNGVGMYVHS